MTKTTNNVPTRSERPLDLVIYAASSFTGQLVVEHLVKSSTRSRWIIAGRSSSKLESVARDKGALETITKNGEGVEGVKNGVFVADSGDEEALRRLCRITKVIITLAGPYGRYGSLLVSVCADLGTHYLDLTGETSWVSRQIQLHHRRSLDTGAILCFSAGVDSLPPDVCTYAAAQALEKEGLKSGKTRTVWAIKGGMISSGTWNSVSDIAKRPGELWRMNQQPYALSPVPGKSKPSPVVVRREEGRWSAFWFLGPHNAQVVRRTWGLLESTADGSTDDAKVRGEGPMVRYGPAFNYDESLATPDPLSAILASLSLYILFFFLIVFPPLHWLITYFIPASSGPSLKTRERSRTTCITTMHSSTDSHVARVIMRGKGDPGYKCTSIMLAEAGLALVEDWEGLSELAKVGGPLTPATVFGGVEGKLAKRMRETGVFEWSTEVYEKGKRPKKEKRIEGKKRE